LSSATVWRNVYFGAEPEQRAQCLGLLDQQSALRDAPLPASYRLFELKDPSCWDRSNSSSAGEAVAVDVALEPLLTRRARLHSSYPAYSSEQAAATTPALLMFRKVLNA
jgi:hypothetical protein